MTIGFEKMLLTGHIGKLVKVAGGIMNTHSKEGDCRMELLVAASVRNQVPYHGARRNPAMCHHGRSSQETGCLWEKRCCDAGSTVKNHVLSE